MARCTMAMLLLLAVLGSQASAHLRSVKQHQGAEDACDCLSFEEAYAHYGVECGQGGEMEYFNQSSLLSPVSALGEDMKTMAMVMYGPDFMSNPEFQKTSCKYFYGSLPDNVCVNPRWGYTTEQWCYVDYKCKHASPLAGTQAAIKICGQAPGQGLTFKPGTPQIEQVQAFVLQLGQEGLKNLGALGRYAFVQWTKDTFPEIKDELFRKNGPSRSDLKEMMMNQVPTLIGSDKDFGPPWFIVAGAMISKIDNWNNQTAQDLYGPYMKYCVFNCAWGDGAKPLDYVPGVSPVTPELQAEWDKLYTSFPGGVRNSIN